MKRSTLPLAVFIVAALCGYLPVQKAAAQCAVCPTSVPVVAYQPVVVPTTPAAIPGWYPGRLLDTWAANRAAYRAATLGTATTAFRPVTTALPVTSFQPVTSVVHQTSLMPTTTYRPLFAQPLATTAFRPLVTTYSPVATTAYSPVVTTFSPVVTASAACCDPCSTPIITSYAPATSACCPQATGTANGSGPVTPVPTLNEVPDYQQRQRPAAGENNSAADEERSLLDEERQSGRTDETSFEAPPLRFPQDSAAPTSDPTARRDRTVVVPAVYNEPVRPGLAASGQANASSKKSFPNRARSDAAWTAASN